MPDDAAPGPGAGAYIAPPPLQCGLKGLCPRCGEPGLFDGIARFAARCRRCGLDFTAFNVGDGPAAFLTLIIGTLVVVGAIALELAASPPLWLHLLVWTPVTAGLVLASLRLAKGWLLALEYRNRAEEGRFR